MSYILTALKKSQQERALGSVPTLDGALAAPEPENSRGRLWMLGGLVAVNLAIIGGLAWYAGPELLQRGGNALAVLTDNGADGERLASGEPKDTTPIEELAADQIVTLVKPTQENLGPPDRTETPAAAPTEAPQQPAESTKVTPIEPATIEPATAESAPTATAEAPAQPSTNLTLTPAALTAPPIPVETAPEPEAPAGAFKAPEAEAASPAPALEQQPTQAVFNLPPIPKSKPEVFARTAANLPEPSKTEPAEAPQQAALPAEPEEVFVELPTFRQMPREYRRSFPKLQVSLHMYHDVAENSFVRINKRKYKAGAKLDEGPRLEEIRPNGIVLSYRGETFLLRN